MWLVQLVAVFSSFAHYADGLNLEVDLYNTLFNGSYNPKLRPVEDINHPVEVELEFELLGISAVRNTDQVFQTTGFIGAMWTDEFLHWDPADFGGIDHLALPPSDVWLPDFGILNSVETFYQEQFFHNFRINLMYTGRIIWAFGGNFETSCHLDMTYYPFDSQKCSIDMINWAYSKEAVNLVMAVDHVVMPEGRFKQNGEWTVDRTHVILSTYEEDLYPNQTFPQVSFMVVLSRKPMYYYVHIVIPCIFVIAISLLVFWLPPEAGKVSLGITAFLLFSVFQLVISRDIPKTSDFTPLLSNMMTCIMAMTTLSIISSIFVLRMFHHPTNRRLPHGMRSFMFKHFSRMMCMQAEMPSVEGGVVPFVSEEGNIYCEKEKGSESEISQILEHLKYMVDHLKSKNEIADSASEWRAMAYLLDRAMFIITLAITLGIVPYFTIGPSENHKE